MAHYEELDSADIGEYAKILKNSTKHSGGAFFDLFMPKRNEPEGKKLFNAYNNKNYNLVSEIISGNKDIGYTEEKTKDTILHKVVRDYNRNPMSQNLLPDDVA